MTSDLVSIQSIYNAATQKRDPSCSEKKDTLRVHTKTHSDAVLFGFVFYSFAERQTQNTTDLVTN